MNRLLFVTTVPDTIKAFFIPITRQLQAKGWRVDAMAKGISNSTECLDVFDQVWEVDLARSPLVPKNILVAPQQIQAVVTDHKYDIVCISTSVASFVTRYALKSLKQQGKPKIVYIAQGFNFYRGGKFTTNTIFRSLEQLAGAWTDYLVVVNREDEEAAKRYRLVPSEKVRYIPGTGVNLEYFNPENVSDADVLQVRQEMGLAPETPLFLSVAEFNFRKRHWDILKAFARLDRTDTHLALAGDGRLFEQMQQLASALEIQNRVHFLGRRQDIPTLIRASVATLLASEWEGLPNCIMESMCMEVPAIGTDARGTRDLLADGCGLLVKLGDVEGLTEAMAWILDRPQDAAAMGKRGRELMSPYELKHILEQYDSLYAEVIEKQNFKVALR